MNSGRRPKTADTLSPAKASCAVPRMDGVALNPPERRFLWTESVHREDFRMRADKSMDGRVARGAVSVFYGSLLLAEVQLSIKVDRKAAESRHEETHARPYRRIFASYSHRDTAIVEEFESHVAATGDRYLRDVVTLRAGEVWDERLLESIKQADVFQLFWSWNALSSNLVREEWRQALALNRPHFVRPVTGRSRCRSGPVFRLPSSNGFTFSACIREFRRRPRHRRCHRQCRRHSRSRRVLRYPG